MLCQDGRFHKERMPCGHAAEWSVPISNVLSERFRGRCVEVLKVARPVLSPALLAALWMTQAGSVRHADIELGVAIMTGVDSAIFVSLTASSLDTVLVHLRLSDCDVLTS